MKKLLSVILAVLLLCGMFVSFAEEEGGDAPAPAPASETKEEKAEKPEKAEKAEEPVKASAPADDPEPAEEKAEEKAEAPEKAPEPADDPEPAEADPVDVPEEPAEPEPAAEEAEAQAEAPVFSASIRIKGGEDPVRLGDTVTLRAKVSDANMEYAIRWDRQDPEEAARALDAEAREKTWKKVASGDSFTLMVTEDNKLWRYRAVAVGADEAETEVKSDAWRAELLPEPDPAVGAISDRPSDILPDDPVDEPIDDPSEDPAETPADELEDASADIPAEAESAEEAVADAPADVPEPTARRVLIRCDRAGVMTPGETIVLTGEVEGFEGREVSYQWECDRGDGFEPIDGATEISYAFEASAESLKWNWRLVVSGR